ncbi:MAG: hypothetical protein WCK96_00670 [Methylococcales bacterium]
MIESLLSAVVIHQAKRVLLVQLNTYQQQPKNSYSTISCCQRIHECLSLNKDSITPLTIERFI